MAVPEERILSLLVESRTGEPVAVLHRDPGQVSGLVSANGGRTVHGSVRVRDEAGLSVFAFTVGGTPEAEVVLRVVPAKVSSADVAAMRGGVEAAWRGAALAGWGAADEQSGLHNEPSIPAWVTVLRYAVHQLEGPLASIERRPAFELSRREHVRPAARLRGDAESVRAIRRSKGRGEWTHVRGVPVQSRMPVRVLGENEDIAAHRWIRQRLDLALSVLAQITREEARHPYAETGRRRALRESLDQIAAGLRRFRRQRPLAEAVGAPAMRKAPLVLRTRPVYREVFDALQALERGLDVGAGEVATAWLGTGRLYESWAVLRVVQVLADVLGAPAPEEPFGLAASGARVRIGRGTRNAIRLDGNGVRVDIAYEPRFPGPPGLLAQRPDVLLTLRAPGQPVRRAVLDAKYRRDDSTAYAMRHGAAGPPEAALGDLHRYRDAIVNKEGEPLVEAAAALFPFHATPTFENSRLWRAHATVGIGAVPLVPGEDEWLRRWILTWLSNDGRRS
ncbi:hypothetical protein BSZ36_12955 [Rubricoccus marinus]|uniref:DUF2357 domain-containing protein n=1 Tax=Rubricoccus marinus TaxID=716817 RepID=A0A259U1B4_9BACT|nr:hypothetical protein BSZ36_12955 [Rubricoccus marinus]